MCGNVGMGESNVDVDVSPAKLLMDAYETGDDSLMLMREAGKEDSRTDSE